MQPAELSFTIAVAVVNLAAGFGLAVFVAKRLGEVTGKPNRFARYFIMLVGIYFLECAALPAGMATQVFSIGLAFVWGVVFGFWLRRKAPAAKILKTTFFVALYTCAPTASFGVLLLMAKLAGGSSIVSAQEGIAFGIPEFVPWPLCTILGFCVALVMGTIVFKTVITTGEVSLLVHLGEKSQTM
jgi:hypothetical protein